MSAALPFGQIWIVDLHLAGPYTIIPANEYSLELLLVALVDPERQRQAGSLVSPLVLLPRQAISELREELFDVFGSELLFDEGVQTRASACGTRGRPRPNGPLFANHLGVPFFSQSSSLFLCFAREFGTMHQFIALRSKAGGHALFIKGRGPPSGSSGGEERNRCDAERDAFAHRANIAQAGQREPGAGD